MAGRTDFADCDSDLLRGCSIAAVAEEQIMPG